MSLSTSLLDLALYGAVLICCIPRDSQNFGMGWKQTEAHYQILLVLAIHALQRSVTSD